MDPPPFSGQDPSFDPPPFSGQDAYHDGGQGRYSYDGIPHPYPPPGYIPPRPKTTAWLAILLFFLYFWPGLIYVIVMAGKKDDWDCRYGPYVYRPRNATPHNGTPHNDPFSDPPQKH